MSKFFLLKYVTFFSGCLSCFILHAQLNVPAVIASCLTGLIGSFITFPKQFGNHPHAAIYAGSFAGMCSQGLINNYWEFAIISLIGAVLYVKTIKLFQGFGGRLGTIAFVSVALFVLAKRLAF